MGAAGEQRYGIGFLCSCVHVADDLFIAGHLNIPAEQNVGRPAQGIEPVDRQQQPSQWFPPMVTAGKMRSFVGDNAAGLLLVQSGGEIDAWVYNAKDERRGNGVAKINVILNVERCAHAPTQAEIADGGINQQDRHTDTPDDAGNRRPHIQRVDVVGGRTGKGFSNRGIHSVVNDRYSAMDRWMLRVLHHLGGDGFTAGQQA